MELLQRFVEEARRLQGTVIFPEGDEERTLEAAARLAGAGVCRCILVAADRTQIEHLAHRRELDLSRLQFIVPSEELLGAEVTEAFIKARMRKGLSERQALALLREPLQFAALYVTAGKADAFVAGARSDTADVLRAALHGAPLAPGVKLVSSYFLMLPPLGHPVAHGPLLYADCAVNPDPGALALKEIAVETVKSFRRFFPGKTARLAFLSFSTKGSAQHPALKKITEATAMARRSCGADPSVIIDGEFQFDAALVPAIAERKAPGSLLKGNANILIFPDLNAGNIGYKMTERLAGFKALGPVIQGLARPFSDLSRGCSVDDIYYTAALTLLQKNS